MRVIGENYITINSIVDGPGLRFVVWFQGCSHKCFKCHNPETHNFLGGIEVSIDSVKEKIKELSKTHYGVTFSGGDPIFQAEELLELSKFAKECGLNVWIYTGFIYEMIKEDKVVKELVNYIDVLVDGPFIADKKSLNTLFRGSTNQRLIDMKKTLEKGAIVLFTENKTEQLPKKTSNIYI